MLQAFVEFVLNHEVQQRVVHVKLLLVVLSLGHGSGWGGDSAVGAIKHHHSIDINLWLRATITDTNRSTPSPNGAIARHSATTPIKCTPASRQMESRRVGG